MRPLNTATHAGPFLLLWSVAAVCLASPALGQAAPPKPPKLANPPRIHVVTLGPVRRVPYTPPDTPPDEKNEDTTSLKVRPLVVDERQREWTTGEIHEVTDRTFAVRRALRLNDALPAEHEARWIWQPGPWLVVDRVTGRITALHLPDFDTTVSNVSWFRDQAAYCGIAFSSKGSSLVAVVAQLGARRAIATQVIGPWPDANHFIPVCQPAEWQRQPLRVSLKPTGPHPAITLDILGTTSLIEEGEDPD